MPCGKFGPKGVDVASLPSLSRAATFTVLIHFGDSTDELDWRLKI